MSEAEKITVAALFVETGGVYFDLDGVDPWDVGRDARHYAQNMPVVAHPPCQLWGKFAKVNYKRWGGEHNKPGNDGRCFESALSSVRRCGGVLEHPASTYAWEAYGLQKPVEIGWNQVAEREWVCEVWQSNYGHLAAKRTWLLYVGSIKPMELNWARGEGKYQIGFRDKRGKSRNKPTISGKNASRTPEAFRDVLLSIARNSGQ